ncbi:YjbH domain-containing protein [Hydrocarboniphaga sp.]|uniref:YjbH domain-containing protein n=1 Tax=Hydrocarboniphaga sp. TaxID=2033016 RepID=UPI003D0D5BF6
MKISGWARPWTITAAISVAIVAPTRAAEEYSSNDFGFVGLMQTPTARMAEDGQLNVGISLQSPYSQLLMGVQLLPWLETQLRYVEISNRLYGPEDFSGNQTYKDRGVDFKIRLIEEGDYLPNVSLGVMDIGGTGLFASEYLVASRRVHDLDFSFGLGWGRLGTRGGIRNPLGLLSGSFDERPASDGPGGFEGKRFFRGREVAPFGGVQWQTPLEHLSLKLEYDGNNYTAEALSNNQQVHLPVNFAFNWRIWDSVDLSAGLERGDTAMLRVSAFTNLIRTRGPAKVLDSPPTPAYLAQAKANGAAVEKAPSIDAAAVEKIRSELKRQQIELVALDTDPARADVTAWVVQSFARDPHRVVGRVGQTLATMVPDEYQSFTVINVSGKNETYRVTVMRKQLQDFIDFKGSSEELRASALVDAPRDAAYQAAQYQDFIHYPGFSWGMGPALRQHVGGPDDFYFGQLWWRTNATVTLNEQWSVSGAVGVNIYNNFDGLKVRDTSSLPHVRSDIVQYLKQGENNLVKLETNYVWSPATDWKARLSAGIFEEMYGGVAGEVLYSKAYSPWAVGLDTNWVRKRDFDQRLGFQDYSVATGHLTGYFDLPFYDLHLNVSVGRYLARDYGSTVELSRQFASGVVVGAFATKTNVSAEDFGEGKFDKGFFIYLPFDLFFPRSTRKGANLVFRPLTRDGGQKVRDGVNLYGIDEAGRFDPDSSWVDVLK